MPVTMPNLHVTADRDGLAVIGRTLHDLRGIRFDEGEEGNKPDGEKPDAKEPTDLEKAQAEIEKWKALSRKNEQQAKDNAEKAKRLDEIEEANKTELEKIQARAEAAEKALAERDAKEQAAALAKEVAKEKGISDASVLRGSTREELEGHADQLLALIPAPPAAPSANGQGETDLISKGEMSAADIVKAATGR